MIRWVVMDCAGDEVDAFDDPWEAADLALALGDCDVIMDAQAGEERRSGLDGIEYL